MPRSAGAKKKAKNAGVGIAFKKAKHKVGRKLAPAQNATDTSFKSKAISLPGQSVGDDKGNAVTSKNLTLKVRLVSLSCPVLSVSLNMISAAVSLHLLDSFTMPRYIGIIVKGFLPLFDEDNLRRQWGARWFWPSVIPEFLTGARREKSYWNMQWRSWQPGIHGSSYWQDLSFAVVTILTLQSV